MTKQELVASVAAHSGISVGAVNAVLNALALTADEALKAGDDITIPGLVKISVKQREARTGRNPATGEALAIAARRVPVFTALKALKDAVA